MSRHGYSDDFGSEDPLALGRWRAQVKSATRGKRGQKLLRDLRDALDAMPEKRLIAGDLENPDGEVCALGALGMCRGLDLSKIDPESPDQVAAAFDIAEPLAREIQYENDDFWYSGAGGQDEQRWQYMRRWVERQIIES